MSDQPQPPTPAIGLPPVSEWEELRDATQTDVVGALAERTRCANLVRNEIETGLKAGAPSTGAAMRILHRLLSQIENA